MVAISTSQGLASSSPVVEPEKPQQRTPQEGPSREVLSGEFSGQAEPDSSSVLHGLFDFFVFENSKISNVGFEATNLNN